MNLTIDIIIYAMLCFIGCIVGYVSFKLKMYMVVEQNDHRVFEYDLTTPWDISTSILFQSKLVSAQDALPTGIFLRSDGLKMYLLGTADGKVYEYDLTTPWGISTLNLLQDKLINLQDTLPTGIFLRSDGLKMYISGHIGFKKQWWELPCDHGRHTYCEDCIKKEDVKECPTK